MKEINSKYDPKSIEEKLYKFWEDNNFFKADENSTKKPYCIVIPPPNVTGNLHMGHALVDTLQDILIRFKRMQGYEALWIPGTDHAGIATQSIVEKHLIATQKKRRKDFSREEFLKHVWKWKNEKESNILNQLKKLGCSLDWSRQRFTMDDKSNLAVIKVFKKMFDDRLIYRGDYLVNWDPITQTALADDEVEYEEKDSYLWHFKYPIKDSKNFITVATTRPETILGDTAIAVSPKDERYQKYIGRSCILPIINREIPIIEDRYVDPSFGSGAVKITPAHDPNDYEIGLRHNLPMINIMTPDGRINENGKEFFGLSMQKARTAVVDKMKELNLLTKQEPYKLRIGISYRSKATIQPYLSKQWFVKMTPFKNKLISAVKENRVKIIPKNFEDTYFHWIDNLRDWCISRQLWWGHRIPVWYNKEDQDVMIVSDSNDVPKEVQESPDKWFQDEDVLDTWFSSALWPFSTLGWPDNTKELKKFYPTSILVTAHDILFFWVARMILMGEYVMKDVPFHETFIHGLIYGKSYWREEKDGSITYVDIEEKNRYDLGEKVPNDVFSKWEKMSKSKGNVIDPIEIINEYGTDAMRIALTASCTHAKQIDLDRRRFDEYKNFSNKIWNAFRFIFLNLLENSEKNLSSLSKEDLEKGLDLDNLSLDDKWILFRLNETIKKEIDYLDNKFFDKAAGILYDFFWNDFCAYYIELIKPYLFGNLGDEKIRKNKQKVVLFVLLSSMRLMHPIAPFITEEIFSKIKELYSKLKEEKNIDPFSKDFIEAINKKACIVSNYPKEIESNIYENIEEDFNILKEAVHLIRNIRAEMQIAPHIKTDLSIYFKDKSKNLSLIKENESFFTTLSKVDEIIYISDENDMPKLSSNAILKDLKLIIPLPLELIEKEKNRLNKEKIKLEKQNVVFADKLKDQVFLENAPKEVIEKMQNNFNDNNQKLDEIENKLKGF
jgi:valyl-tRNA synthetase